MLASLRPSHGAVLSLRSLFRCATSAECILAWPLGWGHVVSSKICIRFQPYDTRWHRRVLGLILVVSFRTSVSSWSVLLSSGHSLTKWLQRPIRIGLQWLHFPLFDYIVSGIGLEVNPRFRFTKDSMPPV